MTPFEYVIVLISIILGLGITTILKGVASWIKVGSGRKIYFPYVIWIGLVFVLHFHEWWESYSLMRIGEWSLLLFLFIILYPIVLYLLANLLFPQHHDSGFNSRAFYFENWKKLFSGVLGLVVMSFMQNVLVSGLPVKSQIVHLLLFLMLGILVFQKRVHEKIHLVLSLILFVLMLVSLVVNRELLTIKV